MYKISSNPSKMWFWKIKSERLIPTVLRKTKELKGTLLRNPKEPNGTLRNPNKPNGTLENPNES